MQRSHKFLALLVGLLLGAIAASVSTANPPRQKKEQEKSDVCKRPDLRGPVYQNKQYRFSIRLPKAWKGYSICVSKWQGDDGQGDGSAEVAPTTRSGPLITIEDPRSTPDDPRQHIPIMVFTYAQWDLADSGKIILSAAPIGPSEIGRNRKFVFALPARYNYDHLPGTEEINEMIFTCGAFHAY